MCLKVLGPHHSSYVTSMQFKGFGMTVGGVFFPYFKKRVVSGISTFYDFFVDETHELGVHEEVNH